ncbi:MAG: SapC family protein [Thermodesulfobacteriaceae bacterium]|nr:SapC family protein [Thermodesulfobacteriaceae bacterium]MCX8041468.1 SapC family protein [Thermodesulfobacteriaceae bacterium]MDW8135749.1 SapC family protein [Thermodesulfobacterium sp.]
MLAPFKAFKSPIILEEELHRDLRILKPEDYHFMQEVEVVPLTFSELLSCSMYYPVMFGIFEGELFPFAVLGVNRKNVYLDEEGFFKVEVIPKVVLSYPFGVLRKKGDGLIEWIVIVDEACQSEKGEVLFEGDRTESSYFKVIKTELSELALDFQKVYEFSQELYNLGCLKLMDFEVTTKWGKAYFKNVLIGNIEVLSKLQPEKLYYLNAIGYLPIIYSLYFSVRNFKLFDLIS